MTYSVNNPGLNKYRWVWYLIFLGIFGILGKLITSVPIYAEELPAEVLYGRAMDSYKAGDFSEAEKLFKKVIELEPKNKKANKFLKKIEEQKIKEKSSIKDGQSKKKKEQKELAALEKKYKRAELYFRKKKYSQAIMVLNEIIAADSSHLKAKELLSTAEKKEAEEIARRKKTNVVMEPAPVAPKLLSGDAAKLNLTKKEIRELYKKGEAAFKEGKYKEALDYFMQVIIADSGNAKARKYIKKSADEILRPRIEKINKQRQAMVFEARTLIFARQKKYDVGALYAAAVKNYKKKNYIRASDNLRQIMNVSGGYKDTEKYFNQIESKMYKNSTMGASTDAETLSYAQGYIDWWSQQIQGAANEWEKCMALNPRNKEVKEYHGKAKEILEMASRKEYQAEIEAKLKAVFEQGENLCGKKEYVDAIKKYENVISISEETPISTSLKWSADARLRIEYALGRLKELTAKARKTEEKQVEEKKPEVIDVKSAQRHYTSGLVAYAQGRLREAIREWELALRLNPGHEKARLALQKAKKELGYE
ncbi:MAG: tetratricopeptide repeat protein [Elusimicrobiota bacterium]|nr:tetratricopeptide repeat protein [Elusimicrobiota bacterium]